jgi:membrane-associated phospholipid phosphatase
VSTTPVRSRRTPLFTPGIWRRFGLRAAIVAVYYVSAIPAGIFRSEADNFGLPVHRHFNAFEAVVLTDWPNRALQSLFVDWTVLQHAAVYVYASWFALPLIATMPLLGKLNRDAWRLVALIMVVYYVGMPFFALYPLSPPWMSDHVTRVFYLVHPEVAGKDPNPFAAMPSLHVALPAVVFLWYGWRSGFGKLMLGYTALIALTVVYSGDHYVADVIAGFTLACTVYAVVRAMRLPLLRSEDVAPPDETRDDPLQIAA